jgi:hypothetical protein
MIDQSLKNVEEWDWDVWRLKEVTNNRPLQTLGWHLLHHWGLIDCFKLDRAVVRNWLVFVEQQYHDSEYHSSTHAADVLQSVHYMLAKCGASEYLSSLSLFALLISAMMHDAGHDGFNNLFHQNAMTDRAVAFNDQSIQENFHCVTILSSMLKDSSINLFATLEPGQAREVRRMIIMMIMGTDMKNHFKFVQEFKSLVASLGGSKEAWLRDGAAHDQLCVNILHAADLSNPCRGFDQARRWAGCVLAEFFVQGDRERLLGLPVSPMCSRDTTLMPASQIGFINFIILPYFKARCNWSCCLLLLSCGPE